MKYFVAHLHPLLVHLPIGILLLAFILHTLQWWQDKRLKNNTAVNFRPFIRLTLGIGVITAVAAAFCGWLLGGSGDYDADTLTWHARLGWTTVVLSGISWRLYGSSWGGRTLLLACAALMGAGHFGGNLTHGADYLFQPPASSLETSKVVVTKDMTAFEGIVSPILTAKCMACHNDTKTKGGLKMTTAALLQQGGKHGNPLLSKPGELPLLLSRCKLPMQDDEHMPPAGKAQPTAEEIRLLELWVQQGASFTTKVGELALPTDLENYVFKGGGTVAASSPVFSQKIAAASTADLDALRNLRINVQKRGTEQPWLMVSLAGNNHLSEQIIAALRKVSEQTYDLDLSNTDLDDNRLQALGKWPNLTTLSLANTKITNGLRSFLATASFIETLNIKGATVTDAGLLPLPEMPRLRQISIWQSGLSAQAAAQLQQQYPALLVNNGVVLTDTTQLILRPAKLNYRSAFFKDTVQVTVNYPFPGIQLHYTLAEAASPTTQSPIWPADTPLVVSTSSHLRVIATKTGWKESLVSDVFLIKCNYTVDSAKLAAPPAPQYSAKKGRSLTDQVTGGTRGDATWLGYEGAHLVAVLDMKQAVPLSKVYVHCLEDNGSWIFLPAGIQVQVSDDGIKYRPVAAQRYPANTAMGGEKAHLMTLDLPKATTARYIRVRVENLLVCPPWHPGKGKKSWVFVDEIAVE